MKTQTLIQAQANVVKITNLKIGDVFKCIEDSNYSQDVSYGIVVDLYNTGEKSFLQALLYDRSYNNIKARSKLFKGNDEINIFPTSVEEVNNYFEDTLASLKCRIEEKKKELFQEESAYKKALEFINGESTKKLTEASYIEMTQEEYNKNKQLLNM